MNIEAYINSGILEAYAMGLLSPQERGEVEDACSGNSLLMAELTSILRAMEQYAESHAADPAGHLQDTIWNAIENLGKEQLMNDHELPLINRFTNADNWLGKVRPFIPDYADIPDGGRFVVMLTATGEVAQALVVSKMDFVEEVHTDTLESFVILEGACECYFGDKTFRMGKGDFTEVPLHTPHSVKILSPYIVAVIQRIAV